MLLPKRPLRVQKHICTLCVQHHLLREPALSASSGESVEGWHIQRPRYSLLYLNPLIWGG